MTTEPRTVYPLVVFNRRPPLGGMTAGQKEGIIPLDHDEEVAAATTGKVVDFRAKVIPANVELPQPKAPAGDAEDPKAADSSAIGSASESADDSSPSGGTSTPTETSPTSPPSSSEPPAPSASVEKAEAPTITGLPVRTIGAATQPAETTGKVPSAT